MNHARFGNRRRVLVVGGGGREHAIAEALCLTDNVELFVAAQNRNPGLLRLTDEARYHQVDEKQVADIADWATNNEVNLAVIGLEDPLPLGLPDQLAERGIPTVGPKQGAARLEWSKVYLRDLMARHNLPAQVRYWHFTGTRDFRHFLESTPGQFALKPDGLTSGKGVKVMGVHFRGTENAIAYGEHVITASGAGLVVEERLIGDEFTMQCFVDGTVALPMPLVQDYKRAGEGDSGPNTGGMGSYSLASHLLPFVTQDDQQEALEVLRKVVTAVAQEGSPYHGILYGQFMKTEGGLRLVEINARFGDPEAMNVLPLLENDLVEVCDAIIGGTLDSLDLRFMHQATVCKYVVPRGYGTAPEVDAPIRIDLAAIEDMGVRVYFAKVNPTDQPGVVRTTSSRSIGLLGIADTTDEAESLVEQALTYVEGRFDVRHDIGKRHLIEKNSRTRRAPAVSMG